MTNFTNTPSFSVPKPIQKIIDSIKKKEIKVLELQYIV